MKKVDISEKVLRKFAKGIFVWFMLGLFIVVQVYFTIEAGNLGSKLALLEEQRDTLSKQNRELSGQIVNSTSLSTIESLTEKLGFIKPQKIVYIESETSVAKAP